MALCWHLRVRPHPKPRSSIPQRERSRCRSLCQRSAIEGCSFDRRVGGDRTAPCLRGEAEAALCARIIVLHCSACWTPPKPPLLMTMVSPGGSRCAARSAGCHGRTQAARPTSWGQADPTSQLVAERGSSTASLPHLRAQSGNRELNGGGARRSRHALPMRRFTFKPARAATVRDRHADAAARRRQSSEHWPGCVLMEVWGYLGTGPQYTVRNPTVPPRSPGRWR